MTANSRKLLQSSDSSNVGDNKSYTEEFGPGFEVL